MLTTTEEFKIDFQRLATEMKLESDLLERIQSLLRAGFDAGYLARYRRKDVGGQSAETIRTIAKRIAAIADLEEKKKTAIKLIDLQGGLTDSLRTALEGAISQRQVDDLFHPFRPKKVHFAQEAIDKGLEELAKAVWQRDPAVDNLADVLAGMVDPEKNLNSAEEIQRLTEQLLAEILGDLPEVRTTTRRALWDLGVIITSKKSTGEPEAEPATSGEVEADSAPTPTTEGASTPTEATGEHESAQTPASEEVSESAPNAEPASTEPTGGAEPSPRQPAKSRRMQQREQEYRDYYDFREKLREIPPHRILAVNRGEKANVLQVRVEFDVNAVETAARSELNFAEHPHREMLELALPIAVHQIVVPELIEEIRKELTEEALDHAVDIFCKNYHSLLLSPPLPPCRLLVIDPAGRESTKLVVLGPKGELLAEANAPKLSEQVADAIQEQLTQLIEQYDVSVIAIGNAQGCRDLEQLVSELIAKLDLPTEEGQSKQPLAYIIANEAGAADYANSPDAREEYPEFDKPTIAAISIGRRLLDPMGECVKIDPQHLGVGLYQHDLKVRQLRTLVEPVISACVSEVGVDVNTAPAVLLRHVASLNAMVANDLVQFRSTNGGITNRTQLKSISGMNDNRYQQSIGFLRVYGGTEPLDETWLHPSCYSVARQLLAEAGFISDDLRNRDKLQKIRAVLAEMDVADTARRYQVEPAVIEEAIQGLADPHEDPRSSRPAPVLKTRSLRLEDLQVGMKLTGTVVNVVPFGAFIDIGLKDTGLVHISELAAKFVKNPYNVVSVGDVVTVWVVGIDSNRKRASLTMIDPAQPRPKDQPREQRPKGNQRPPRERQPGAPRPPASGERGERRPPAPRGERPAQSQPRDRGRPSPRPAGPRSDQPRPNTNTRPPRSHQRSEPVARGSEGEGMHKPAPRPPAAPRKPEKPRALPKLTKEELDGKKPLLTFGALEAFFKSRETTDEETKKPPKGKPKSNDSDETNKE
ncbi:MAG: Tex-like N-terminal domain-containing protein [Zavarzinella sp.]